MSDQRARNSITFFRPKELAGVRVAKYVESTKLVTFYTNTYDLVLIERAQSVVMSGGKVFPGTSGGLMLLGPYAVFAHLALPEPETLRVLHIPPETVEVARRELAAREQPREAISHGQEIRRSLVELHRALDSDSTPLERQGLFASVLHSFFELPANAAPIERYAVRRAREMLHEHFREPVSLDELCRTSGVSPFHLHRSFKRATGVAPHAYQNSLRVANARILLERGIPPCEAALDSGFYDQSHLTRHFQRAHGITPAQYARSMRSLSPPQSGPSKKARTSKMSWSVEH